MAEPLFDVQKAHRWFAVETNNRAWDLVENDSRSPAETVRMLCAAHASCYHWLEIGTPINQFRSECLLATAYLAANGIDIALHHAECCLAMLDEVGDEATAFDRATAYGVAARAHTANGQRDLAIAAYSRATEFVAQFESAEDRAVFDKLYPAPVAM